MRKILLLFVLFLPTTLLAQHIVHESDRAFQKTYFDSLSAINIPNYGPAIVIDNNHSFREHSWLRRKLFEEHFIIFKDSNFNISIDPILDLRYGKESNRTIYQNTRGIIVQGQIDKHFFFRSEFYENQAVLPIFATHYIDSLGAIPGMIRTKNFGTDGFDYGMVFGQIAWNPVKSYALRLGFDRFHIGNGYRSMILSDAAPAYAFISNSFQLNNWSITNMFSPMRNADFNKQNFVPSAEIESYQQKWFSLNYLTWSPTRWLNISLAEATIFTPYDSTKTAFNLMSIVPIPFIKTALYEKNDKHHVINSLTFDFIVNEGFSIYSQFVFDEIKVNKKFQGATQIGAKWSNPMGLKKSFVQAEYNFASNNAYTSENYWTSMTHTDQALAHPQGQNFTEILLTGQISYKRYFAQFYASYLKGCGLPYQNYFGKDNSQTNTKELSSSIFGRFELGWYINPITNFQIFGGAYCRLFSNDNTGLKDNSVYFQAGIRHSLRNQYYDFF